jgi:hypothetical protein
MFRGKNGYFYRPPDDGRFRFLQWDSDLAFREANYPFYSDRVAPWLEQPQNLKRFQGYLAKLVEFSESPRLRTWLEMQEAANPSRPPEASFYQKFFQQRNRMAAAFTNRPAPQIRRNFWNFFVPQQAVPIRE